MELYDLKNLYDDIKKIYIKKPFKFFVLTILTKTKNYIFFLGFLLISFQHKYFKIFGTLKNRILVKASHLTINVYKSGAKLYI